MWWWIITALEGMGYEWFGTAAHKEIVHGAMLLHRLDRDH
jgi:hypothetical protein